MQGSDNKGLGRLIASHGISPLFMQRAVFVSVLSFLFFLAMMITFYVRQNSVYFLLATAFLLVYLITMFSMIFLRKTEVRIFEKGFTFKKRSVRWDDIADVRDDGIVSIRDATDLAIPHSISDFDILLDVIRSKAHQE